MAFNFPDSPSPGTTYSPFAGLTYTWNGSAWAIAAAAATFPDAGADGLTYGRRNNAWERAVRVAGDTMTGTLNGTAISMSGNVAAATLTATGAINGAALGLTGNANASAFVAASNLGVVVNSYVPTGSDYVATLGYVNPNWNNIFYEGYHAPGVWAGASINVNGTQFSFRNAGQGFCVASSAWGVTSDARIKDVRGNYTTGLEAIAALRPVRFVFLGNNRLDLEKPSPHGELADSKIELVGLLAQQVEGVMPELIKKSRGYIDGVLVEDLREMDIGPMIYAMVNAIKELKTRVEELEAERRS